MATPAGDSLIAGSSRAGRTTGAATPDRRRRATPPHTLFVAAIAALWPGGAFAADADGAFAIKGAGVRTCGAFVADWDADGRNRALYGGWLEGYVTAVNQYEPGTFDATPWQSTETLLALLREACRAQGDGTRVLDAAVGLLRALSPQRLAAESPLSGLHHGERGLVIYEAVLEAALRRLREEGFAAIETDGGFGPEASEAFAAFQRSRGLPESGLPDQQTLAALFLRARSD